MGGGVGAILHVRMHCASVEVPSLSMKHLPKTVLHVYMVLIGSGVGVGVGLGVGLGVGGGGGMGWLHGTEGGGHVVVPGSYF